MPSLWRAIRHIPEYRGRVLGVLAVGTILGVIGTATPYIYKGVVDAVSRQLAGTLSFEAATTSVLWLLGAFFLLRIAVVVFGAIQNSQADNLWLDAVSTFRQRVFDNMTIKSIDYFEKTRVGEIMDRFGTIPSITMWLSTLTEGVLASVLQMFLIITVLAIKVPLVGLIMAAVLTVNFWISLRTVAWGKPHRRGWQEQVGRMSGLLAEMVGNISTVRSFGGEDAVKQRYDETQARWRVARDKLHKVEWRSEQTLNGLNTLAVFAAVAFVTYGALHGRFTPGDILLVLTLIQNLITSIAPVSRLLNQAGDVETSAERLVALLDAASEQEDKADALALTKLESITFADVSFRYPGKKSFALEHVSFHLEAGQTLALVGNSGSGKSTIVKLLMRFYDPTEGEVLINGVPLREYTQRSVRATMGVVLQDVALFNDSIGENIAFARPGATSLDIEAAARAAHAHQFISRMEKRYDTRVGERGIKLSGGEKQRVAIARAILKDPQLIVLDEATSALDSESEHLVKQGLQHLMAKRTSLIIAHRLSTVMQANHILVMRDGLVIEQGTHRELVQRVGGGLYAQLFDLQTRGAEPSTPPAERAAIHG